MDFLIRSLGDMSGNIKTNLNLITTYINNLQQNDDCDNSPELKQLTKVLEGISDEIFEKEKQHLEYSVEMLDEVEPQQKIISAIKQVE